MANVVFDVQSIKAGLFSKCKNEKVFDKIQEDVCMISRWTVEASIYIHFRLNRDFENGIFPKKKIKFSQYFNELKFNHTAATRKRFKVDPEYGFLRKEFKLSDYDSKQNLYVFAQRQYEAAFKTNIKTHAYKHVGKFLSVVQRRILNKNPTNPKEKYDLFCDRRNVLDYTFNGKNLKKCDADLLNQMREFGFEKPFKLTLSTYFRPLKLLYNIQRYNEANEIKNFNIMPIFKHGRNHVRYDNRGMWELLKSVDLSDKKFEEFDRNTEWAKYFDYKSLERKPGLFKTHHFDWSIATDGVAVTFKFLRVNFVKTDAAIQKAARAEEEEVLASEREEPPNKKRRAEPNDENDDEDDDQMDADDDAPDADYQEDINRHLMVFKSKLASGFYHQHIGLDPGLKLTVGGASYGPDGNPTIIWKKKSSKVRDMCRAPQLKHKRKKLCGAIDQKYNPLSKAYSAKSWDYRSYARFRLLHFIEKQEVYEDRRVTRLRFKKYILVEKAITALAKELVGHHKHRTLVHIGASKTAANSPMKGYVRSPQKMLLRKLKIFADVLEVNEYKTTKLCSRCHVPMLTRKPSSRYRFCQNCRSCWNRDVNAGHNIYLKGLCHLEDRPPHPNFAYQPY